MPYPGSATNWSALFSRQQPGGYFVAQNMFEHPNNIWFVSSVSGTDGTGYGRSPAAPFATLDYSISHANVTTGDTHILLPLHAENLDADSAVDVDVNNQQILGLGWGGCRPTFTCTDVDGDFKLAASCGILQNVLFINGIDNSTGLLEVSSADWTVRHCEFRETAALYADFLITLLDGSDRFHYHNNIVTGNAADGSTSAMSIVSSDWIHLHDNFWYGNYDTGVVQFITTASAGARIHDSTYWQVDDTAGAANVQMILDTITGSTGIIGPNLNMVGIVNAANITEAVTGATFNMIDPVYVNNLVNEKGMLIDWTASTDA